MVLIISSPTGFLTTGNNNFFRHNPIDLPGQNYTLYANLSLVKLTYVVFFPTDKLSTLLIQGAHMFGFGRSISIDFIFFFKLS